MSKSIETIEGIGPKTGASLRKAGVRTVEKLLETGCTKAGRKALAAETGIDEKQLLRYVNMADLFRIKGVAGQWAELLEAAGVDTVKELRNRNPENLAEKMREINKQKRLVKQVPNATQISSWVDQAKKLKPAISY